jgi:DNA-binding transcriptional regulator LsrR (DeoR family)
MLGIKTIAKMRRFYHVQGKEFKTIARELKVSKNTVKRIIREDITVPQYRRKTS